MPPLRALLRTGFCLIAALCLFAAKPASAKDYVLTLGGGFNREENQASLEANVLFFKQVLKDKHPQPLQHDIFFAHGNDAAADLQVVADKPKESDQPATELIASLYRRGQNVQQVTYRKHQVSDLTGPLDPALVRDDLEKLAKSAATGDRLIIYVTSHGSPGPKDDPFNTSIDCWDGKKISAKEFSQWLDKLPEDMPVVMVMAQCYCGGFARLIFQDLDESKGATPRPRVGFFAQHHDLQAAGCRPDIEHDDEFSSYFWGAIAGHRRGGAKIDNCDLDGDGVVSFAEAYAYAVAADDTIDVPLRTSEIFLRKYSIFEPSERKTDSTDKDAAPTPPALAPMSGSLQSFVDRGDRITGRIIAQLAKALDFKLDDDVSAVRSAYKDQRPGGPQRGRGGRAGQARRDLLKAIGDKWPELADERHWKESSLLAADNQKELLAQIKDLPSWKAYDERLTRMATARKESEEREVRSVKLRRLLIALEDVNLAANLPLVAEPDVVARYQKIVALEGSSLSGPAR